VGYLDNVHTVETYENSLIRKIIDKKEFWVNSNHHQALDKLGKNIKVTGVSPKDNIIEVIEFKKEDDIKTDFSSISVTGANPANTPGPNPPFSMP